MSTLIALVCLFTVQLVNIALHSIGCYLLITLYKRGQDTTQRILLINLSATELLLNVFGGVMSIQSILILKGMDILEEQHVYTSIIRDSGLMVIYFIDMYFITIDRLLEILLNINYYSYVSQEKVKYLLFATWLFGIILTIGITVTWHYLKFDYAKIHLFVYPPLACPFVPLAIIVYSLIFYRYRKSRVAPTQSWNNRNARVSIVRTFRQSKFFVVVFIILSFLLFVIFPGTIYSVSTFIKHKTKYRNQVIIYIIYHLSHTVDFVTYVFLERAVRMLMWKIIGSKCFLCCKDNQRVGSGGNTLHLGSVEQHNS